MKFPDVGGGRGGSGGGKGGLFIKMADGDKIQGVFMGDPKIFRQHYIKEQKRSFNCPGSKDCQHCKAGDKPKFRFRLNFLTKEDGVWVAKIFEQGYGAYIDLKELHENEYSLPETCVIVKRTGEGTDTRYRVTPAKDNGGLKPDDFKKLAKIPLNDLSPDGAKVEAALEAEESDSSESDLPF